MQMQTVGTPARDFMPVNVVVGHAGKPSAASYELVAPQSELYLLAASVFDEAFYLEANPDVRAAALDPLTHYLQHGWREGRDPSASFSTRHYLDSNVDVAEAGTCPLLHYVISGTVEGRCPLPTETPAQDAPPARLAFDEGFYVRVYPDVVKAGIDPFTHYVNQGWLEGRNPSANFSTRDYLDLYADVRDLGMCPLIHYATTGQAEGRLPRRPPNPEKMAVMSEVPIGKRIEPWLRPLVGVPLAHGSLRCALTETMEQSRAGVAIALSHDDYVTVVGGVQNCLGDEERALRQNGWAYLHVCPAQPLPVLADDVPAEAHFVWLRINGRQFGLVSVEALVAELGRGAFGGLRRVLILHHLMGFSPERVIDLAEALEPTETICWLHDFFSLCSNFALMRNNVAFCHAPPVDSSACSICAYGGGERRRHLHRMEKLFNSLQPTVLAPSRTALEFWLSHTSLAHAQAITISHGTMKLDETFRPAPSGDQRLRVGFLGGAAYHKGWAIFEELATRHFQDSRYAFYHLGASSSHAPNINFVQVTVNPDSRHAMVDAVIASRLDVVINWSLCFETFSFSSYESMIGGSFLIGRKGAGNVPTAIVEGGSGAGVAVETKAELFALFESGEVFDLLTHRRFGELIIRSGTAHYMTEGY